EDTISASLLMKSGALASFTATLGAADDSTRIRLAFEHVSFESDHAAYNPGEKPWKIQPRHAVTGAATQALHRDWRHWTAPVPTRHRPAAGHQRRFPPLAGAGPRLLPSLGDRPGRRPADRAGPSALRQLGPGPVPCALECVLTDARWRSFLFAHRNFRKPQAHFSVRCFRRSSWRPASSSGESSRPMAMWR